MDQYISVKIVLIFAIEKFQSFDMFYNLLLIKNITDCCPPPTWIPAWQCLFNKINNNR